MMINQYFNVAGEVRIHDNLALSPTTLRTLMQTNAERVFALRRLSAV
jgi:hypothetical protein